MAQRSGIVWSSNRVGGGGGEGVIYIIPPPYTQYNTSKYTKRKWLKGSAEEICSENNKGKQLGVKGDVKLVRDSVTEGIIYVRKALLFRCRWYLLPPHQNGSTLERGGGRPKHSFSSIEI